jgi:predicted MFS family arabinose efflux permease
LLLQGWRLCYYGAGIVGLIITLLTAFTLREPERQTIGEESGVNANDSVVVAEEENTPKSGQWKVMLQPRVIMLCIAASIRHTGKHYGSKILVSKSQPFRSKGQLIIFFTMFTIEKRGLV